MNVLVVFVLALGAPCLASSASSKPVSTLLQSYWPRTSLLLEARHATYKLILLILLKCRVTLPVCLLARSEFMWDYEEGVFWKFVEATKDIRVGSLTQKGELLFVLVCVQGRAGQCVWVGGVCVQGWAGQCVWVGGACVCVWGAV